MKAVPVGEKFKILFKKIASPALVTLFVASAIASIAILSAGGNPLALARLGSRYALGDPNGEPGYDGQFVYYIALNPDPQWVTPHLDDAPYRYQRILLPLLARGLSLGDPDFLPWVLVILGVFSLTAGTWAVQGLLTGWGVNRWYALIYGLWVGFLLAIIVDLPEPLAYGLLAVGLLAYEREHIYLAAPYLALAILAKEVSILFVLALLLGELFQRRWRRFLLLGLVTLLPFALFQLYLYSVFGRPGFGLGGDMATPLEWIPFMGLWRIGAYSPLYLLGMFVVFGPTVVFPTIWALWMSLRRLWSGEKGWVVWAALINALFIVTLPFAVFRETGGLLRLASGLVVAILFFTARYAHKTSLNYCLFWLVLNVFLLKS